MIQIRPRREANMKKQIFRIIIFALIVAGLGFYMKSRGMVLGTKANVVGNLRFTYPNGLTPERLFNETDFKPGDCKTAPVTVKNLASSNSIVGVFSEGELQSDGLASSLTIEIADGVTTLYGPLALSQFFTDSEILNQIELLTLTGNSTASLDFTVCFPNTNDNELQGNSVVFDLKFGQITPPIELPEECDELEGTVTAQIDGTSGDDNINGTSASEFIQGFEGKDKISGGGGHDCIIAGDGNDKVSGGTGNDIIVGGIGDDKISAGTGNDKVFGGGGNDQISGGSGLDELYGNEGDDKISGGSNNDLIYGGSGNDKISGGSGEDDLFGEDGDDKISGDSQNDYLHGGPDSDTLNGNSGTDTCVAGETLTSCEL